MDTSVPNQTPEQQGLVCRICHQQIRIEDAKTDGDGRAVHDECYARELKRNHDGRD
jgi:hypothetical protein